MQTQLKPGTQSGWAKRIFRCGLVLISLCHLAGCATLSREQCERGDWYGIGMGDGQKGVPANRLADHVRACGKYGFQPDDRQYRLGHDRGLEEYCRIDNAFATGLQGNRYQGVCPSTIDALFERCNQAAYAVYRIRQQLDALEDERDRCEFRLRNSNLSQDDRHQLHRDLRNLDRRYFELRDELFFSERSLDRLMDEVTTPPRP